MNTTVKRVLYGNQKQATLQIETLTNFVSKYLSEAGQKYDLSSEESVRNAIMKEIVFLSTVNTELGIADKMFLRVILGVENASEVPGHSGIVHYKELPNGKCDFWFTGSLETTHVGTETIERHVPDNLDVGRLSKEDEAYALVGRILEDCHNRYDYPKDDVLAAILYGEIYWRNHV